MDCICKFIVWSTSSTCHSHTIYIYTNIHIYIHTHIYIYNILCYNALCFKKVMWFNITKSCKQYYDDKAWTLVTFLTDNTFRIFQVNYINTITADALAPDVTRPSTAIVLAFVRKSDPCLLWENILTTSDISIWSNATKCKYAEPNLIITWYITDDKTILQHENDKWRIHIRLWIHKRHSISMG